jgi:hypothetical protein
MCRNVWILKGVRRAPRTTYPGKVLVCPINLLPCSFALQFCCLQINQHKTNKAVVHLFRISVPYLAFARAFKCSNGSKLIRLYSDHAV